MKTPQDLASLSPEERRALLARLLAEKAERQTQQKPASYPLSFAQQRLWFLDRLQPHSGAYNVCRAFWLRGQLDVDALRAALKVIIGRHQSLQTTFMETEDGRPIQIVSPNDDPALTVVDLRSASEPQTEAIERMNQEAARPFDLSAGPLFRQYVWQTAENESLFLVAMHHIVSDAWSLSVFFRELSTAYETTRDGRSDALPPLPMQYTAYAQQQRERLQGETLERHLAFWQKHLDGIEPLLDLPTDHPRPPALRFNGRDIEIALPKTLSEVLKAFSRRHKTTPYTVLLAAFNTLLARYTASEDIVIGSPLANRNEAGIQGLIGFFVNVMPVRIDLSGNPTFTELLQRVQATLIGTMSHQELPFERLVEEIQPERELSRHPIFQVVFAMQNVPDDQPVLAGLSVKAQRIEVQSSKFDLTLFLRETAKGYAGSIEYNADLFESGTIERFVGHFQTLLAGIIENPGARVSELPILPAQERRQLLFGWNRTQTTYSTQKLAHQLVEEQAKSRGNKTAVIAYQSPNQVEAQLTYEQLNGRANQLAHYLRRLGVGPETPVGVCMSRSAEMAAALLGVLKAGGAYLPLDLVYPRERLAFMLQDAAQMLGTAEPILLTQSSLKDQMPTEGVRPIYLDASWATVANESMENPDNVVSAENLAYIIYTSGTTGRPKGIQLEHRSLLNLIFWHQRAFEVTEADRATQLAGPAFDASVWELWPYLTAGAAIHIPDDETRLLPWQMRNWLIERGITISFQPTPLAEAMLTLAWPETTPLRKLLTGGDKLTHFPPPDLPFELINNYGPTENTVVTTFEQTPPEGDTVELPPIGRPVDNVQVYITDKHLNLVPVGVPGELLIGGESLARGYLKRPDLTAAAFIPNPFHPEKGRRLYRTGDLAKYLPDGRIAFVGRIDHQVKIRGFRIELGEIETVVRQHTTVAEALVLTREDIPGDKRLVGYVIPRQGTAVGTAVSAVIEPDDLRRFLGERLPEYMVPAAFVSLSEWPFTPNGKIDRRALPAPDWQGSSSQTFTAPRTPDEAKLAAIWREVLGLAQVGVHDNFFELGGDSILSIQILARANQAGFQFTTRQLFQHQTIVALAANVGQTAVPAIEPEQGKPQGDVPLTPIQRWFFEQDLADRHHWNMAMALETRPNLSPETLSQAFAALLDHHDGLRLRFVKENGNWKQHYVNTSDADIVSYVNLADLSADEKAARFAETAEQTQSALNLEDGPLIRVVYFDYGAGENGSLLIVIHHLVVDGVSWRILLEDSHNIYEQIAAGRPIQLPKKTVSFQQWANRLGDFAQSEQTTAEVDDWLSQPWQEIRPIPLDYSKKGRAANLVERAETLSTTLTQRETQTLLQTVPAAFGAQINDVLLTALGQTFAAWSGARTMLVDLEGHGREEFGEAALDSSRTVGWFTSMYPVALTVDAEAETAELVTSIQEQLADIPGKGLGYGLLRYMRQDTAEKLHELPQAEVSFNYLGQFDNILPPDSAFRLSAEAVGATRSPRSQRKHLLNINARVMDGRLEISWTFSRNHHRQETIAQLAESYRENLRQLIEERPIDGVSRAVRQEIKQATDSRNTEAVRQMGPGQVAMVAHSRRHPNSEAYFLQWVYEIEGKLDTAAFRRAWEFVVGRHEILRTLFVTAKNGTVYQAIVKETTLDWRELDWQKLSKDRQQKKLAALLAADRERGFRPSIEPPMRWVLVKFGRNEYRLIWSHHHALLDGWSMAPLWQEALMAYEALRQGRRVDLRPPVSFSRYLDWIRRQPLSQARNYWQERLAGFDEPIRLANSKKRTADASYGWAERRLSVEETAALQQFAQRNRLTLNTMTQGAWAQVLAQYSGREDVIFGVTSAGRPSAIPGVEQIVGLMLNTLPMRVTVAGDLGDEDGRVAWLRAIQEQQAVQSQYEHVSLAQVQRWSEIEKQPLFESFLRFQNYPMKQFLNSWQGSLTIRNSQVFDQWHYPLSVIVVPEDALVLRIGYDEGLFTAEKVGEILAEFRQFITH